MLTDLFIADLLPKWGRIARPQGSDVALFDPPGVLPEINEFPIKMLTDWKSSCDTFLTDVCTHIFIPKVSTYTLANPPNFYIFFTNHGPFKSIQNK